MNDIQAIMGSFIGAVMNGRWVAHNCPACVHNGQPRADTKKRAGQYHSPDGAFSFHCFNCGYKTYWRPGFDAHRKLLELAGWYGATDQQKGVMIVAANDIKQSGDFEVQETSEYVKASIIPKDMPEQAKPFSEWAAMPNPPIDFIKVVQKVAERNEFLLDTFDFWWTPEKDNNLNDRYLVPFHMHGRIVGYTGRITWKHSRMKYLNQYPENFLYNIDLLYDEQAKDILVVEGPIDAGLVNGVATCHYTIRDNQLDWLKQSNKNIIVVPDRDKDGRKMVEQAIQNGFSVALPDYGHYIDDNGEKQLISDVEQAVRKYGRLYTRYLISKSTYKDEFEIRVRANQWF